MEQLLAEKCSRLQAVEIENWKLRETYCGPHKVCVCVCVCVCVGGVSLYVCVFVSVYMCVCACVCVV